MFSQHVYMYLERSEKEYEIALELELWLVICHHGSSGKQSRSFVRATSALNGWALSLVPRIQAHRKHHKRTST